MKVTGLKPRVPGDLPVLFYDEIDASEGFLEFYQLYCTSQMIELV